MNLPDFSYETVCWQNGCKIVAGLDEVGRGSFAGPVVAGCVVFGRDTVYTLQGLAFKGGSKIIVNDSKKLSVEQKEVADLWIRENALAVGIGSASVSEINKLGIKKATDVAFRRAITFANKILSDKVSEKELNIDYLLIDAFHIPRVRRLGINHQKAIIKGDSLSVSIAAASIVAKVYRDKLMISLCRNAKYAKYGWQRNKGYGTKEHRDAIKKQGITKLHRTQFVKNCLATSLDY